MTDASSPQRHARLLGAYWLDSPVLPHDHCVCRERPLLPAGRSSVRRVLGLRGAMVGLAVLVIAAALAAVAHLQTG
ncbi:hypothetical protein ACFV6E_39740 [Streptomyces sp. NPDC059785]|uniref:hypothetical protein n=1 Tax=unclassified Streptomyces TaxID=2593676 RepID=UPI00364B1BF1